MTKDAWQHAEEPSEATEQGTLVRRIASPAQARTQEVASPVAPRTAALAFMNGSMGSWSIHELVTWIDQFLVRPGRLLLRHPYPTMRINESGIGTVIFGPPSPRSITGAVIPQAETPRLVRAARQKVSGTLSSLLSPNLDDRFVQAAIYEGRVVRQPGRGRARGWGVIVSEEVNLSDQVLALFACDVLDHRDDYVDQLVVCEVCGTVEFWPDRTTSQGCRTHPEGLVSVPTRRGGR